jgi:hypothetical protein
LVGFEPISLFPEKGRRRNHASAEESIGSLAKSGNQVAEKHCPAG